MNKKDREAGASVLRKAHFSDSDTRKVRTRPSYEHDGGSSREGFRQSHRVLLHWKRSSVWENVHDYTEQGIDVGAKFKYEVV